MAEVANIQVDRIKPNTVALRGVDRTRTSYIQLKDSIEEYGIMQSISLSRQIDPETKEEIFVLIDGLQRFSCAQDLGFETIPAQILEIADGKVHTAQIICNMQGVETTPAEYSNALHRLLNANPRLTLPELAQQLHVSAPFIQRRLHLKKLVEAVMAKVDDKSIPLVNAFCLAKLPEEEQVEWMQRAMTDTSDEFVPACTERIRAIAQANKEGRDPAGAVFTPLAKVRSPKLLKAERTDNYPNIRALAANADSPEDAAIAVMDWVLSLDADSVNIARDKWDMAKAEKERATAERKAKLAKKKQDVAAKATAEAQAALSDIES